MGEFFRLQTTHGGFVAIYRPTGALCFVDDARLGDNFAPALVYAAEGAGSDTVLLMGERDHETVPLLVPPYRMPARALPCSIAPSAWPGYVCLKYPGTKHFITALLPTSHNHFGGITADRLATDTWEFFRLVPVSSVFIPGSLRALASLDQALIDAGHSLLTRYVHFVAARSVETVIRAEALVVRFESLGYNCEFGFVQRNVGAEPLGLLRFAGGLALIGLIDGIRARFAGLGDVSHTVCDYHYNPKELVVRDTKYDFAYHTWRETENYDLSLAAREESQKMNFLARKLIEDLEDGEKIFVFHINEMVGDLANLAGVLSELGDSTLLYVQRADPEHHPGEVVWLRPNVMLGYVRDLAPIDRAWDVDVPSWLHVCARAHDMWSTARAKRQHGS